MTYSVNYHGSHPDSDNDDCWTGSDFETLEQARIKFSETPDTFYDGCTAYVELEGPGVQEIRANPTFQGIDDGSDQRRELAMEEGMLQGVHAYNEIMGYD